MNKSVLFLPAIILFALGCCNAIKPTGENYRLLIEIRKVDDPSNDPSSCDGDIWISNPPPGPDVTYRWSHDKTLTEKEAHQLCAGHYKITITKGSMTRVTQVIIN